MRTRLTTWNFASSMSYSFITLAVSLATTPLLERWLNPARFGAVRVANDLFFHLTILELGLAGTLGPLLAGALARNDERTLHHTLSAGVRAYLWLTLPVFGVGLALTAGLDRLIPLSSATDRADLHIAWVLGLAGWLTLGLIPMRALIEASQQGYRVNLALIGQNLLMVGLSLLLAWRNWGITGQMLALAVGSVATTLYLTWDAHRRHPGLLSAIWTTRRPDPEVRRALWKLSLPTLAFNLSSRLGLLTDYLIVSSILGPAMVTPLFFTQRLASLAQIQLQAIGNASWAALAELHGKGERVLFNRRLIELTGIVAVLGVAALGPIIAFDQAFMKVWLKERSIALYAGDRVILIAAINSFLLGIFSLWGWCFGGTGQVGKIVTPLSIGSILNLAVSLGLTYAWRDDPSLALAGPLLGTTAAFLTVHAWVLPLQLRRSFGTPIRGLFGALATPIAWGIPYTAALWWLARAYPPPGWFSLGAEMAAASLAYLALAARFLLSPTDRALWKARLMGLRAKSQPTPIS